MAYELRALVSVREIAAEAAAELGAGCCRLADDLHLVPLLGCEASEAREESSFGDPMLLLTPAVESVAERLSRQGRIAYVEAEFFGSAGTQAAACWEGGSLAVGPMTFEYTAGQTRLGSTADRPINSALRWLGVLCGTFPDEFDAVGLGRHRWTEEWLPEATN